MGSPGSATCMDFADSHKNPRIRRAWSVGIFYNSRFGGLSAKLVRMSFDAPEKQDSSGLQISKLSHSAYL